MEGRHGRKSAKQWLAKDSSIEDGGRGHWGDFVGHEWVYSLRECLGVRKLVVLGVELFCGALRGVLRGVGRVVRLPRFLRERSRIFEEVFYLDGGRGPVKRLAPDFDPLLHELNAATRRLGAGFEEQEAMTAGGFMEHEMKVQDEVNVQDKRSPRMLAGASAFGGALWRGARLRSIASQSSHCRVHES